MKALETPEEKRQRRLAKKEQKELSRRRKMGWDKQMIVRRREITDRRLLFEYLQGYSNADNPFGDEHLTDRFVWQKVCYVLTLCHLQKPKKKLRRVCQQKHG